MKELTAWLVGFIMIMVAFRYAYQVYTRDISPTLSTWLIFLTGTSLSFVTYMVAEDKDFQSGILNTIDVMVSLLITFSIVIWGKTLKTHFKPFEKKYLISAGGIVLFWIISKDAFTSNLLVQLLIFIGYFPTIQNLVTKKKNTESLSAWGLVLIATIIALYPAIVGGNLLAVIYVGRTVVMVNVVLCIMLFYHFKAKTPIPTR